MKIPNRIIDFICDTANFSIDNEYFFRNTLLSTNRSKRMTPTIVENLINGQFNVLSGDYYLGVNLLNFPDTAQQLHEVRNSLKQAFGDVPSENEVGDMYVIRDFTKKLYLNDYLEAYE